MANDDPTSRRMVFGAKSAMASGVTEFRVSSTSQMNAKRKLKPMQMALANLVKDRPYLEPVIVEIVEQLTETRGYFHHDDIMFELEARGHITWQPRNLQRPTTP